MAVAFVFPGQGSQYIGMGKDLAGTYVEARETFQEIDDILSQNLSAMMFDGDKSDLDMTENTQPALMAVSMAVINVLKKQAGLNIAETCQFVAGHSLGEYSALCTAEVISLADTTRLLRLRGTAMQKAVPEGIGSMAAILGMDYDAVVKIAQDAGQGQICVAANDNSNGQVVISGHKEAVERAIEKAIEQGARRAITLPVSVASHCALMAPAAEIIACALTDITFDTPISPVIPNVTADAQKEPESLKKALVEQITGTVRWRESVLYMRDEGVTDMVEIGAGKVLCGLARRIDRSITTQSVETSADIETLVEKLSFGKPCYV
ncbi:MAG: ACP S-malonyltransferase [Alphaproteobacteria bacterium]|nr:ACP S-malonyltransferase [Alphaproteobacteria bacterium]